MKWFCEWAGSESWDADPAHSQNHFMLGHAETWLYGGLAGIQIDMSRQPAERIRIAPQTVDGIQAASARYRSVLGEIAVSWRKENERLHIEAEIPAGATATIEMTARTSAEVLESGKPLRVTAGMTRVRHVGGTIMITVGSGRYKLSTPLA